MKPLPAEILLLIFNRLHFKQKLECMLACRAWANVLLEGYLFETIELSVNSTYKTYDNYIRLLMKKARAQPFIGNKCTRLLINDKSVSWINAAALASSFPKLKFLDFQYDIIYTPGSPRLRNVTLNSDPFEGWKMSLETLIDRYSDECVVFDIPSTGIFKNLTTLTTVSQYGNNISSKLIVVLKNEPALTTLDISIYGTSISRLEELHKNTPNLVSLTLQSTFPYVGSNLNPMNIKAAEKLKILKIKRLPVTCNFRFPCIEYIKLKYICLEEFSYDHSRSYDTRYQFSSSDLNKIFSNSESTLKKFTIRGRVDSTPFLNMISQRLNRLESLSLRIDSNQNCLDKLLKNRKLYGLRSLLLYDIGTTDLKLEGFKSFTNLKEIGLCFRTTLLHLITLQDVIEKLPKSLETFIAENITSTKLQSAPRRYSNIINLKLYSSTVNDKGTSLILNNYFPKLKTLVLVTCDLSELLNLSKHHLRYVEYISHMRRRILGISYGGHNTRLTHLQITTADESLYFNAPAKESGDYFTDFERTTANDDFGLRKVMKPSPKAKELDYFELKCASVEIVYFEKYLLLL